MNATTPPTRDELLAMAFVDGELTPEAEREFRDRLAHEEHLAREVAELQGLALIARQAAPPEPQDHEWRRLEADPVHVGGTRVGFALLAAAGLGLSGWGAFAVATAEGLELLPKLLVLGLVAGFAVLFLVVLRARMRIAPLDPYTKVQR